MLRRVFEMLLPVRPEVRRLSIALFFHSLFAVGAFLTGRTVRDALFLSHAARSELPWMYVASAAAVALTGLFYARVAARLRRDVLAVGTACGFALVMVLAFAVEKTHAAWVYSALYVTVEVMGGLVLVQFWTLANELFHAREARRLYGFIGAGGTVANILIGLLAARVATTFGTASLILLVVVLLIATAGVGFVVGRLGRQRLFARAASFSLPPPRAGSRGHLVRTDAHLRAVALLSLVTFFTTTLIDFEFKVVTADLVPPDSLAAFFSYFSAVVGVLSLSLQLFGTNRLLSHFGVVGALAVLPISLGLGSAALALVPSLWAATMAKGSDALFRYSLNDATTQILYLPVPAQPRAAAKAFIDGVIKPLAVGLSGLSLVAYRHLGGGDPYRLAWISCGLSALWLAIVFGLRSEYVRSLQDTLRNRRLALGSTSLRAFDTAATSVLEKALASQNEEDAYVAISIVAKSENEGLDQQVEKLLEHSSARVRVRALEYFARRQTMRFANSIFRCFEDPHAHVRAAAIDAFCAMGRDKAVRSVETFLADPDPSIRGAAVTGMIRFGGLDGVLIAAEALKGLIDNESPSMRQVAAKTLGAIGVRNFYQPVLQLMNDPDLRVRREALAAAGCLRSLEFVIPLVYRTQSAETRREAIAALTTYGGTVVPLLDKVLQSHMEDAAIQDSVAKVLGKVGTKEAAVALARNLSSGDDQLRGTVYHSLARAAKGGHLLLNDLRAVHEAVDRELDRAYRTLHLAERLDLSEAPSLSVSVAGEATARALLALALGEKVAKVERRVFVLLGMLYPDANMEHIAAGLAHVHQSEGAGRRGNAVELLDNLLDARLKRRLLPLLEDAPRRARLAQVADFFPAPPLTEEQALDALSTDESAWVRACALWCMCMAQTPSAGLAKRCEAALEDANPMVREMALVALGRCDVGRAGALAQRCLKDGSSMVRRQASAILALHSKALQAASQEAGHR